MTETDPHNPITDAINQLKVPIHKEGYPFIGAFAGLAFVLWLIHGFLGFIGLVLTLWCIYFFRNPERVTPTREGFVVSPADGVIQHIRHAVPPAELQLGSEPLPRISIFMNVFDVHVNRMPVAGHVTSLHYHAGKFLNAAMDKASDENERQLVTVQGDDGNRYGVVQIAGLVARRIVTHVKEGDHVLRGQRFGIIRFGSRVDVFLPAGTDPLVLEGQRAIGGETVLAVVAPRERPARIYGREEAEIPEDIGEDSL